MDTSEYMPMFLAEAREHLQELNLAVVQLEEDPSNRSTVDRIFRIAHSFKGMSATMGFSAIAELTHVMEDAFELLRQRSVGLKPEAVSTVLACLDALELGVDSIEASGQENLDPAPLIQQLRSLIRDRTPSQELERDCDAALPGRELLEAIRAEGKRVMHVTVRLSDEAMMPAVRAHMVFASLGEHGELIGSIPATDIVESFEGRRIEAWVASNHLSQELHAAAAGIGDVVQVTVSELSEPGDRLSVDTEPSGARPDTEPSGAAQPDTKPSSVPPQPGVAQPGAKPSGVKPSSAAQPGAKPADKRSVTANHPTARTVRVDAERLDSLMHLMGELVIHRTAVEAHTAHVESPELQMAIQNLTRSSQALQQMVMNVRMIPVDVVFMRFPRLVRDLSNKLGKNVELELVGRDTELDRTVVDALGDPLVHLVRNSLDHGLEPAEERRRSGKPDTGKLMISARHAGGSVVIEVRDDGRGVNPAAVASTAVNSGLIDEDSARNLDMRGAIELLFSPGFSTTETTSDISGRGVGMDAVRAKIRELGGEVIMESTRGEGTIAQIRLPLTLAIVSALQVEIAGAQYAIPIDRVERALRISEHTCSRIYGRRFLSLDDGVLPLLEGAATFGHARDRAHDLVVIVRGDDKRIGITVAQLVGLRELVTRPLPAVVCAGGPVSGGAVLADGNIALIVDCDAIAQNLSAGGPLAADPASRPTETAPQPAETMDQPPAAVTQLVEA